MSTLCNQSVCITFKCITKRQLRENAGWKQGKLHQKQFFFFLLPSEDGDFLQSQLFWEIAGKIHFLFCWVPSKPHGWSLSVVVIPPPSASWETPLSQMVCFLLIITQQKPGYVLFIIHSFSLKKKCWHHLHWTLQTSPESIFTDLSQSWALPDEKYNHYRKTIFSFFLPKSLLLCFAPVSNFLLLPCL